MAPAPAASAAGAGVSTAQRVTVADGPVRPDRAAPLPLPPQVGNSSMSASAADESSPRGVTAQPQLSTSAFSSDGSRVSRVAGAGTSSSWRRMLGTPASSSAAAVCGAALRGWCVFELWKHITELRHGPARAAPGTTKCNPARAGHRCDTSQSHGRENKGGRAVGRCVRTLTTSMSESMSVPCPLAR
jgi:hypothetical protein